MRKSIRIPLLVAVLSLMFAGTVLATVASTGFHPTLLSRGTINQRVNINNSVVEFETKKAVDIVTATVTFDALGSSGWHAHPGIVLVTVLSGTLTEYDEDCVATVQVAGTAFVESGRDAALVRNESTTTKAVSYVTYIVPKGTPNANLRIDKPNPGCPKN